MDAEHELQMLKDLKERCLLHGSPWYLEQHLIDLEYAIKRGNSMITITEPMNYKAGDDFVTMVEGKECVVRVVQVLLNRGALHQYLVEVVDEEYKDKF